MPDDLAVDKSRSDDVVTQPAEQTPLEHGLAVEHAGRLTRTKRSSAVSSLRTMQGAASGDLGSQR